MTIVRSRSIAVVFVGALLASCNESTAPVVDPNVDEALNEMAAAEALAGPGLAMIGATAPPSGGPTTCVFNAGNKRFECAPFTSNGITGSRYYQLLDASGAPQAAWGPNVVAIKNVMDVNGTFTPPAGSSSTSTIQMTSHDESTLSGLQSETKTLTGAGTSTTTISSPQLGSQTSNMTRTTNLSLPKPGPDVYPTGTSTMTMTVPGSSAPAITMTMTYNGTSIVTMTTNIGGTARVCTLDLKNPGTQPVCTP